VARAEQELVKGPTERLGELMRAPSQGVPSLGDAARAHQLSQAVEGTHPGGPWLVIPVSRSLRQDRNSEPRTRETMPGLSLKRIK